MPDLLTLEEFRQLPDDELRHELDEGKLICAMPANLEHGRMQARIGSMLWDFVGQFDFGEVLIGSGYILRSEPPTVRAPDVSFLRRDLLNSADADDWPAFAPDLAVEIVSPSETAAALERKVRQYLRAGTHTVWVVYPEERTLHVYEASGAGRVFDATQTLTADELLPGLSIPVSKLFE